MYDSQTNVRGPFYYDGFIKIVIWIGDQTRCFRCGVIIIHHQLQVNRRWIYGMDGWLGHIALWVYVYFPMP